MTDKEQAIEKIHWHLTQSYDAGVRHIDVDLSTKANELYEFLNYRLPVIPENVRGEIERLIIFQGICQVVAVVTGKTPSGYIESDDATDQIINLLTKYLQQ